MAGHEAQFYQLLYTLRSQAEEEVPVYLVGAIQNAEVSEQGRQTAAVLLRRLFSADFDLFPKLPFEHQTYLREQLLLTIQMDITQPLRRKVCDVVSELARIHHGANANQWPEFLQFMFTCANAQDSNMKEAGIRILTSVPGVFGLQNENLDAIKRTLLTALQPTESEALRAQAVKAVGALILLHDKEPAIQEHLSDLLEPTMRMVRDKDQEDKCRQLALEVMVTLCDTASATVREGVPTAMRVLTPLVLEMMCEIKDDPEWAMKDEAADDDNENGKKMTINNVAESALDRMCWRLGGEIMLELTVGSVPEMLQSKDWRRRHAALMAVSSASKGCHKQMEQMLDQVVPAVLNHLADPHPRVRYAACSAVGQMSTDFAPIFAKKFHDKVVPGLVLVLNDNGNPRVQAHAVAAVRNFSVKCPKPVLTLYLDPLMMKLEVILTAKIKELIDHGRKHVLEQTVTTIGSIADTVEKDFIPYYGGLMPCLKYIIANATTADLKMLRGNTIQCVSLIGQAALLGYFGPGQVVRKERLSADASAVMDSILKTYTEGEQLPADDRQIPFLIPVWFRFLNIMGKKFARYLPMVIGPVMRTADLNLGLQAPGACQMLVICARVLKEAFVEYAEDVMKLMVPKLKFYVEDDVRVAAADSLPYLLDCARIRGHQKIEGMWAYILPELLKALDSEPVQDVQLELLYSLERCIVLLGAGCLTEETIAEVLRIVNKLVTEHFERATERRHDEVVEEQLAEDNEDMVDTLRTVAYTLQALLSVYSDRFPRLDTLLPHLAETPTRHDAPQRIIAMLAEALLRHVVPEDSDVFSQMVTLVRQIQSNAELFNSCLMQLSDEHKEALQHALSRVA